MKKTILTLTAMVVTGLSHGQVIGTTDINFLDNNFFLAPNNHWDTSVGTGVGNVAQATFTSAGTTVTGDIIVTNIDASNYTGTNPYVLRGGGDAARELAVWAGTQNPVNGVISQNALTGIEVDYAVNWTGADVPDNITLEGIRRLFPTSSFSASLLGGGVFDVAGFNANGGALDAGVNVLFSNGDTTVTITNTTSSLIVGSAGYNIATIGDISGWTQNITDPGVQSGLRWRADGLTTNPVPEPTSIALLGLGGLALIGRRKRA